MSDNTFSCESMLLKLKVTDILPKSVGTRAAIRLLFAYHAEKSGQMVCWELVGKRSTHQTIDSPYDRLTRNRLTKYCLISDRLTK